MYKNTPKIKNVTAKIYAAIFLICGAALFFLPVIQGLEFGALIQSGGIVLITASVYIATAYLLRSYTFAVAFSENRTVDVYGDEYENPIQRIDFTVYDNKPGRSLLVCRIGLDEMERVEIMDKSNRKKLKESVRQLRRYKYDNSFLPTRQIVIVTAEDCVTVTYDEALYRILTENKN